MKIRNVFGIVKIQMKILYISHKLKEKTMKKPLFNSTTFHMKIVNKKKRKK